ncbi:MAG TPA: sulfotransferase domain-containing protein [Lacipirellulaceae bacterium]|nr:sulfotransferase domain-containing protein [Lacipirellulaceae bacterium]
MANELKLAELEGDSALRLFIRRVKRHPAFRIYKKPGDLVKDFLPNVWRMSTHHFRHLPTTVIVGAQKAGTTQLFAHLVTHPRCYEGSRKEVDYFSKNPHRSVGWYRSHFPLAIRVTRKHSHVMEASPSYLPTPSALRQMRQVLPKARVIVLLRDPVSRAFSHYQHRKTRGLESRTFAECVAEEIRANPFPANLGVAIRPKAEPMLGYLARGYYALQLELLLKLFPRNKVLVLDSAGLFNDTTAICERVFNFMGLDSFEVQPKKIYNRGYYKEKIDPVIAEALHAHFQPYNELLPQVIEQQFSWTSSENVRAKAA